MTISKGFAYTFLAALTWAIAIIIAKVILQTGENSYNLVFWTTLIATPYWISVLISKKSEASQLIKRDYIILLAMGLISTVGVALTEALAIKYSPAINYSFLIRTVILFTIVFAYFLLGEKLTLKKIILSVLLLSGAYLLTTKGKLISLTMGDTFTLIEAALIALGNNVLGKMATNHMSTSLSSSAGFLIGIIPIALIAYFNHVISIPRSLSLVILLTLSYIVLTNLRFNAYKNATASFVTMVYSFTPVFVSFMAIPILKEIISPIQIVGGILIIIAGISVEKLKI